MITSQSSINQASSSSLAEKRLLYSVPNQSKLHLVAPQGQIEVHTSKHRGSFSMVFSEALRDAGLGSRVLIAQFLKGGVAQGPLRGINLCGKLEWLRPDFSDCIQENYSDEIFQAKKSTYIQKAIKEIWDVCLDRLRSNNIQKLVLDEIGLAIKLGFISEQALISTLEERPESIDVILTGPAIPLKVISMADQVTQLRCGK